MPKHRGAANRRQQTGRRLQASRAPLQPYLLVGGAVVLAVFAFVFVRAGGSEAPTDDPAQVELASANAAGDAVKVLTGSRHTVYHSVAPLPSAGAQRADGRATLVWFSGTWCEFCERMEPFAHQTAGQFADRLVFVEKSVDDDRNTASRYGVRGTPTFVLIDVAGREVARFGFQRDAASFIAAIESALGRVA